MAADAVNWTGECQAGRLFILVAVAVASPVYNTDLIIAAALCWVVSRPGFAAAAAPLIVIIFDAVFLIVLARPLRQARAEGVHGAALFCAVR